MGFEKSPLADVISAHWDALKRQYIDVPELQVDGRPVRIWFDPLTLKERDDLNRLRGGEAVVELLILKATDEGGSKLFSKADKVQLMNACGGWAQRVADRISFADSVSVDALGKP